LSQTQPPKNVIVAMTANAMPGDAQRCLAAGMDDYIAKPISLERIFDIIKKYCPSYQTNLIQLPSLENTPRFVYSSLASTFFKGGCVQGGRKGQTEGKQKNIVSGRQSPKPSGSHKSA